MPVKQKDTVQEDTVLKMGKLVAALLLITLPSVITGRYHIKLTLILRNGECVSKKEIERFQVTFKDSSSPRNIDLLMFYIFY